MDMKKTSVNSWKLCFNRQLFLAVTCAGVALYGLQVSVAGKDDAQSPPVPAIAERARIIRYERNNSHPVRLNLTETHLFFGLSRIENGSVIAISPAEWDSFLEASVSPLFNSFTVFEAMGNYRGLRESTKILMLLHQGDEGEKKIQTIARAYIERFEQDGVLRIDR